MKRILAFAVVAVFEAAATLFVLTALHAYGVPFPWSGPAAVVALFLFTWAHKETVP